MRFQRIAPKQAGEQDGLVHGFDVNHAFADGVRDGGAEHEDGDEIPEGGPENRTEWRQNTSGDDGSDGIGGVVPTVGELEGEGEEDNGEKELEVSHGKRPG